MLAGHCGLVYSAKQITAATQGDLANPGIGILRSDMEQQEKITDAPACLPTHRRVGVAKGGLDESNLVLGGRGPSCRVEEAFEHRDPDSIGGA